jgi:hypothetical protein
MGEKTPSAALNQRSLAALDFPVGEGPKAHTVRLLDPRVVAQHFAPLLKNLPSAEVRWARKAGATPFPGL